MSTFAQVRSRIDKLHQDLTSPSCSYKDIRLSVDEIKVSLLKLSFLLPGESSSSTAAQESILARDLLELASLAAVRFDDETGFERHFAQLKTYYEGNPHNLEESKQKYLIIGLNLMLLLSQNRISEFHTELELISIDSHSNSFINFPMQLEQYLMEGNYQKLLSATNPPGESYKVFLGKMRKTIRGELASCSEHAYSHLRYADAQKIFQFNSEAELLQFCVEHDWKADNRVVHFGKEENNAPGIPTQQTIHNVLTYAKELERIV